MFREIALIKLKDIISGESCIGQEENPQTFLKFFVRGSFNHFNI